jgi:hypothetical protein
VIGTLFPKKERIAYFTLMVKIFKEIFPKDFLYYLLEHFLAARISLHALVSLE